jgi:hypothetical protein
MSIATQAGGLLFVLLGFALTFIVARTFSRIWRDRRRSLAERAARAGETRQVRRARERKLRK